MCVSREAEGAARERLVLLYPAERIAARVAALAAAICRDYAGRDLVVVGVLKGAFVFAADLVRALARPLTVDFVGLSSYGAGAESAGTVTVTRPLEATVSGKDVLVVEDILDTGLTMRVLLDHLRSQGPRSVRVCALVDKRARRVQAVPADYVGFTIDRGFVVGYGIDYAERYRWLPDIYRVESAEQRS